MFDLLVVDTRSHERRSVPLQDGPLTFGSSVECELVLPAAGIAPRQGRIEWSQGCWWLVDLVGHAGDGGTCRTRLNGNPVDSVSLHAGDVLEVGPFRVTVVDWVVDQVVDPMEATVPPAAATVAAVPPFVRRGAHRSLRERSPTFNLLVPAMSLAVLLGVALLAWFHLRAGGSASDTADTANSADLARPGEQQRERMAQGQRELDGLRLRCADDVTGTTLGLLDLFCVEYSASESLCAQARRLRDDVAARASVANPRPVVAAPANPWTACMEEADRAIAQGEFNQAHVLLTSFVARDGTEKRARREALARVDGAARSVGEPILQQVHEAVARGRALEALAMLSDERLRPLQFTSIWYDLLDAAEEVEETLDHVYAEGARPVPRRRHAQMRPAAEPEIDGSAGTIAGNGAIAGAGPDAIPDAGDAARVKDAAAMKSPRPPAPAASAPTSSCDELEQEARERLAAGDFAKAAQLLELALEKGPPAERRPEIARIHERAQRPCELADRLAALLAEKMPPHLTARLLGGEEVKVVASTGTLLVVEAAGERREISPRSLDARSLLDLSGRVPLTPEEALDRAFVALAVKDDKVFFACVEKAAPVAGLKESIDSALAFQRGLDRVPARGFVKVGERWLTWEEKAAAEMAREARELLAKALGPKAGAEEARRALRELARAAPAVVIPELRARRGELKVSFDAAPEQERLAKLSALMIELKAARKRALELIFDEVKYFYPHPPEKEALYMEVQQEVDRRVGAVRAIWGREDSDPPDPQVTLSTSFQETLRQLTCVREMLVEAGAASDDVDRSLVAAWSLPLQTRTVHVRNFAFDANERVRLDRDLKVLLLNAGVKPTKEGEDAEELEQALVTNRYRMMMGRRALAWNQKLWKSARGHSDYMARIGVLTHSEEDPARSSPIQRMQLEGYTSGAGENCMVGSGDATAAHVGWCHSSGHHRNLLYDSHTEIGSARSGAYWTQNFGGGAEYRGNLLRD